MARRERAAVILFGNLDQRQQRAQFLRRALDMRGQAAIDGRGWFGPGPVAPLGIAIGCAEQGLAIAPQRRCHRAFIALGRAHAVDCLLAPAALGRGAFACIAVALQRFPFALDARQFGAGLGQLRRCRIARRLQFRLARLHRLDRAAQVAEARACFFRCRTRRGDIGVGILARQRGALFGHAPSLCLDPVEPRARLRDRSFGDAPFSLDPGIVGSRARQREFGGAAVALGLFASAFQRRAAFLVGGQRLFAFGEFAFEPRQRLGGVPRQAVGIAAVGLEPRLLAVEIGQPLFGGLELAGQRGHAVAMRAGIVAAIGLFLARFGQPFRGPALRLLRLVGGRLRLVHARFRIGGSGLGLFGCRGGIAPAREDQPGLGGLYLVGQFPVALGLLRLPAERGDLAVQPGHDVLEPFEIGLGLAQLAFRIAAADVQPGDPGGFLEHLAAFGRLGGDHLRDLALADQRGAVRPGGGIGEDQRHVLGAHIASVEAIGAARAALDPADDFHLVAVIVRAVQHHFGEIALRAALRTREDDVFHPARAHRLGRVFAHHPADRLEQVGLAAAIGADDPRQPRFDMQGGRFDEALEAA